VIVVSLPKTRSAGVAAVPEAKHFHDLNPKPLGGAPKELGYATDQKYHDERRVYHDCRLEVAAPQGEYGIEYELAGLDWFADKITVDSCGGGTLHGLVAFSIDCPATIEWAGELQNRR
jgi:hypothetical protein